LTRVTRRDEQGSGGAVAGSTTGECRRMLGPDPNPDEVSGHNREPPPAALLGVVERLRCTPQVISQ
jgi:hypothetical protein